MRCDPKSLLEAAKCYRCIPRQVAQATMISLLCEWANASIVPPVPEEKWVFMDTNGFFWKLVVDTLGNVGMTSDPGPVTPDVILDDGVAHWKLNVDTNGIRYATSSLAAVTAAPVVDDGTGTLWTIHADTNGNIYATS